MPGQGGHPSSSESLLPETARKQKTALSCCVRTIVRSTFASLLSAAAILVACAADKSQWTDAQLHLTQEQARGRAVYNNNCAGCHAAYSSKNLNGPPLQDLSKKRAMPSGAPPTD